MLTVISVGEQLEEPPLPEGAQYQFDVAGHILMVRLANPTSGEIRAVESGKVQFAMYEVPEVLFLLYQFGEAGAGIPISDCSYSWHLVAPEHRKRPNQEMSERHRELITIILVDSLTGIVRAIRAVTFSPEFTVKLQNAIRRQIVRKFSRAKLNDEMDKAYAEFPTARDMLRAAQARCVAGEK